MNKIKSSIMKMNFRKFFPRFIIISLVILIIGGAVTGFSLRTQISELIAYERSMDMFEDRYDDDWYDDDWGMFNQYGQYDQFDQYGQYGHHDEYGARDYLEHNWPYPMPFTEPSTGAKVIAVTFGVVCLLILAVYWLAVTAWLYQAAVLSGMNHVLWPLAGLFCNLLAVAVFLVVRWLIREKCPSCGHWNHRGAQFCESCGADLQEKCPACGKVCPSGSRYCPSCGAKLPERHEAAKGTEKPEAEKPPEQVKSETQEKDGKEKTDK